MKKATTLCIVGMFCVAMLWGAQAEEPPPNVSYFAIVLTSPSSPVLDFNVRMLSIPAPLNAPNVPSDILPYELGEFLKVGFVDIAQTSIVGRLKNKFVDFRDWNPTFEDGKAYLLWILQKLSQLNGKRCGLEVIRSGKIKVTVGNAAVSQFEGLNIAEIEPKNWARRMLLLSTKLAKFVGRPVEINFPASKNVQTVEEMRATITQIWQERILGALGNASLSKVECFPEVGLLIISSDKNMTAGRLMGGELLSEFRPPANTIESPQGRKRHKQIK